MQKSLYSETQAK